MEAKIAPTAAKTAVLVAAMVPVITEKIVPPVPVIVVPVVAMVPVIGVRVAPHAQKIASASRSVLWITHRV